MNDVIERTKEYYNQFKNANTDNQRQALIVDYKAYYNQLAEEDRIEADKIHDAHFAETLRIIDEMEPALQKAKDMLARYQQPA